MKGEQIIYQSLEEALKKNGLKRRTRKNVQGTKSLDTNNFASKTVGGGLQRTELNPILSDNQEIMSSNEEMKTYDITQ